jgi:hypothetical protein
MYLYGYEFGRPIAPANCTKEQPMTVERALRLTAGTFVLVSVGLSVWHSPWWLLFTAFVGLNLFQSGLSNWCPAMWIYQKLGLKCCVPAAQA